MVFLGIKNLMTKIFLFWHLVHVFKYVKLDKTENQSTSGSIYKYVSLNLWFSCKIYLNVGDVDHELHFCDRIPNERNQIETLMCSLTILIYFIWKFFKALFCDKNLKQNEVNSTSFQSFAFCKNSSFSKKL